ncbi:MAG: PAS domain S-box protein, partial [Desulfobacterales bacterium]|nr:PAS domain S-box protein [Desulfobacterales bacterium]
DRILTLSRDFICIAGMDGYFKYVNPAWEKLLGYTNKELLSRPFLDFIHPDDHRKNDTEVATLSEGKETIGFENRYVCKNGSIRYIQWMATPLSDEGLMHCIGRDITEHRRMETALLQSESKYKSLIDNINSGVAVYEVKNDGEDFIFVDLNRAGERIDDIRKKDIIGKNVLEIYPGIKYFGLFEILKRVWETGNPENFPIALYKDDRISGRVT